MFDAAEKREQAEKLVADFCDSPDGNSGAVFCAGLKVIITDNLKAIKKSLRGRKLMQRLPERKSKRSLESAAL